MDWGLCEDDLALTVKACQLGLLPTTEQHVDWSMLLVTFVEQGAEYCGVQGLAQRVRVSSSCLVRRGTVRRVHGPRWRGGLLHRQSRLTRGPHRSEHLADRGSRRAM